MTSFDPTQHQADFFDVVRRSEFRSPTGDTDLRGWVEACVETFERARTNGNRIFFLGNGASQSLASHYAADLTKNGNVPALTLSDAAMVTCFANDYSYEDAWAEMFKRHFLKGDTVVAISSSGASKNVLNAVKTALERGGQLIGLSGFDAANPLRAMPGWSAWVPSRSYGFVECTHTYFLHVVLDAVCARVK